MDSFYDQPLDLSHAYNNFLELSKNLLTPGGEVVLLQTAKGNQYSLVIGNYREASLREPLEDQLIAQLLSAKDTKVNLCFVTVNGKHPEIPSWHLRKSLIDMDMRNLDTRTFLWGGEERIAIKPFSVLLPPKSH